MIKIVHKVVTILVGVLIAKVTRALFTKAWRATAHQDEVPQPTDAQRRWAEVLLAAALQGMAIALAKAAVERAAAESTHKLTGVWTGENPEHAQQPEQAEKAPAMG